MIPSKYMVSVRHKPETVQNNRCSHSHHFHIWEGVCRVLTGNQGDMSSVETIPDSYPPVQWGGWLCGRGGSLDWFLNTYMVVMVIHFCRIDNFPNLSRILLNHFFIIYLYTLYLIQLKC